MTCRITKMCRQIFRQYRDDVGIVPYIKKPNLHRFAKSLWTNTEKYAILDVTNHLIKGVG